MAGSSQTATMPGALTAALVLWSLSAIALILMGSMLILYGVATVAENDGPWGAEARLLGYLALGAGGYVLTCGTLLVWLTAVARRGRSWARVALTIVGLLSILPLLVTLIGWALVLIAIVLQFQPQCDRWFRAAAWQVNYA